MLLFRSEEHVQRWCRAWKRKPGAIFSLEKGWRLAKAWYEDRLDPDWRPLTSEEATALFRRLGFASPFWRITNESPSELLRRQPGGAREKHP